MFPKAIRGFAKLVIIYASSFVLGTFFAFSTHLRKDLFTTVPSPGNGSSSECHLQFIEYHSSDFEELWAKNVEQWESDPCKLLPDQRHKAKAWINYSVPAQNAASGSTPPSDVFSMFKYRNTCNNQMENVYIEPLAFITRHPFVCAGASKIKDKLKKNLYKYLPDKTYIVIDWNMPRGKALYFDLGASFYDRGAGGNSPQWMVDQYAKRGVHFDRIFGWEAKQSNATDVFAAIPGYLHHKYHWYNFPIICEENSDRNPWTILSRVAVPEDYVVVKVDIDTPGIENALVQQLIKNASLNSLVDELYFEHHVNVTIMAEFWGNLNLTLSDTFDVFLALRRLGIRAHSWV